MTDANDRRFMKKALMLAEKGIGLASPNPSVGCLIVKDNQVVGQGWHEFERLDHAEVRALQEASGRARGATAYVTLEPCSHHGRTPPCADTLLQAGVSRVVVARKDPNPRVAGSGVELLRSGGVRVDVGFMAEAAGKIIEPFARHVTSELPLVTLKAGMSLDGKIGTGKPEGRRISSSEGMDFGQKLRLRSDAVLVGIDTVLADDPALTYRGVFPKSRSLTRVVLDTELRTPSSARLFENALSGPVLLFCGEGASKRRRAELKNAGAEIVSVPGSPAGRRAGRSSAEGLDLNAVLKELGKRNILEVLVEGGSAVHWSFLSAHRADIFYFIISPLVLGGKDAIPSVGGKGYDSVEDSAKFRIRGYSFAGKDMVVEAYPSFSASIVSPWLFQEKAPSLGRYFPHSSKPK
jgi:diaminohydroxyphosphoribosylaminopyrimidine deaminase / 5-amino-6-(5-phosphoribosylamino)uracil reductase